MPLGAFYDQLLAKEKKDKSLLGLFCVAARPPKWRVAKRRGGGDAAGRHEGWARAAMPLVFARTIMRMRCMERGGEPFLKKRREHALGEGRCVMSQVLSLRVYCIRDREWPTHGSSAAVVLNNGKTKSPTESSIAPQKRTCKRILVRRSSQWQPTCRDTAVALFLSRFSSPSVSALLSLWIRLRV